jgi:phage-related tail protein
VVLISFNTTRNGSKGFDVIRAQVVAQGALITEIGKQNRELVTQTSILQSIADQSKENTSVLAKATMAISQQSVDISAKVSAAQEDIRAEMDAQTQKGISTVTTQIEGAAEKLQTALAERVKEIFEELSEIKRELQAQREGSATLQSEMAAKLDHVLEKVSHLQISPPVRAANGHADMAPPADAGHSVPMP